MKCLTPVSANASRTQYRHLQGKSAVSVVPYWIQFDSLGINTPSQGRDHVAVTGWQGSQFGRRRSAIRTPPSGTDPPLPTCRRVLSRFRDAVGGRGPGVAAKGVLATEKGWMVSANWGKIAGWWPAQSPSSPVDDPLPGGKKGVYFAYTLPGLLFAFLACWVTNN